MVWKRVSAGGKPQESPAAETIDVGALRAEWQAECDERVQASQSAGFREGEAAGRTRAAAEIQPVMERLALAIARRVLRRELAVDPDAMHGLVLGALEKLQTQEISRVRVHPSHAAQVTAYLRKAVSSMNVEVVPDSAREPGTVIFETPRGDLDASVDSQLQEIERGLVDRLRKQA